MPEDYIEKLYSIIDRKRGSYLEILKEAVAIRSETGDPKETRRAITWIENKLKDVGATTTLQDVGSIAVDGKRVDLPPVLIADIKSESSKMTLLVYGHLDVRHVGQMRESVSSTDSYNVIEENGVLFGRGVTDSKGPLMCWLNAIQAFRDLNVEIPINVRFVIEAMRESGSIGLMEYLQDNKGFLFKSVNYICISDSTCLFYTKPVITYGLRGCCKFVITVEGGKNDLHSGCHGGMISEPMTDVISLLCSLTNNKGEILIPNFRDNVEEVTPEEEKTYHKLSFDVAAFKHSIGIGKLLHKEDKKRLLMHRSRFPSLTIHSVYTGEYTDDDAIPCKVSASFTIRIVPNQTPDEVFHKVQIYLMYIFNRAQSPNRMTIEMPIAIPPWVSKPDDGNYKAASKAVFRVYKQEPEFIREGSSIPIVAKLQQISGKSVLLLPVGCSQHAINNRDRMDVKTYMDGTKVIATYMYELAQQKN